MARVAIVTGGTRGIGAAISKALKAAGYQVAATYHSNDEAAEKFKAETGVHVYKWDVSVYDDCVAGHRQVEKDLGPVDVLVNNAGITKDGMFHKMTPEQWYAVINTNLNSLFNMTRPVIEGMRERGFGRIINISSVNGQKGQMGSRTTRRPRPATSASPRRWPRRTPTRASRSTRSARAISRPKWSRPCRRKCWTSRSCRTSRCAASASPRKSPAASCSSPPTRPGLITGSTLSANGGQYMV